MATTAVPITATISDALKKAFQKSPALEELWGKVNARIDATQKELGSVDVKQQQTQAAVASKPASVFGGISPWLIVGALVLLVWLWRKK